MAVSRGQDRGILSCIGRTPLVPLRKLLPDADFELYAKLECLNPGGSIKDRPALTILEHAMDRGEIGPDTVIIESSSGNMGIGLAQACRYFGLRFICVVDAKTAKQNIGILRAYGAEVEQVLEPDPQTGELLQARIRRVRDLRERHPDSFWPNQYANPMNPRAHDLSTMAEVADALDGRVDFLFVATSTCGTIRGCADYARRHGMSTRIVAVDARGSRIFSEEKAERWIPGLGAGLRPEHFDPSLVDHFHHVTDLDCVRGCRTLVAREAIFAGGSSGAVVAALERLQDLVPAGANCVLVLPDRGERYLDTVYSNDWVRERFGELEFLGPEWSFGGSGKLQAAS
ncbi:MAG TPA: 2,3-diaminopropionate biosynthesis protein SbnA [Thermoanaerobaculia bacterium]|nr:2,3-diaminopropionate biosynthesis protein SbnA [Thermoanaerobaculia bacterium]